MKSFTGYQIWGSLGIIMPQILQCLHHSSIQNLILCCFYAKWRNMKKRQLSGFWIVNKGVWASLRSDFRKNWKVAIIFVDVFCQSSLQSPSWAAKLGESKFNKFLKVVPTKILGNSFICFAWLGIVTLESPLIALSQGTHNLVDRNVFMLSFSLV